MQSISKTEWTNDENGSKLNAKIFWSPSSQNRLQHIQIIWSYSIATLTLLWVALATENLLCVAWYTKPYIIPTKSRHPSKRQIVSTRVLVIWPLLFYMSTIFELCTFYLFLKHWTQDSIASTFPLQRTRSQNYMQLKFPKLSHKTMIT